MLAILSLLGGPVPKRGWLRVSAEAGAIAIGVFLSLWADQWREDRSRAAEGRAALIRMAQDLADDTARVANSGLMSSRGVAAIDSILNAAVDDPSTPGRIAEWIPFVLQSSVFNVEGEEYEALRSSGRLGLITDPELLGALTSYYADLEYIAEMYRFDIDQSHAVAELMYPHIEFPRDDFVNEPNVSVFPTPVVHASVVDLLSDRLFVNEMTYLGFLKELTANSAHMAATRAAELLRTIDAELQR